jgi:hypothetical protein
MHKKQLIIRPYKKQLNIEEILIKFFYRINGKFANVLNYNSLEDLSRLNLKKIVSVPVSNLFSCIYYEDKNGKKKKQFTKKTLLRQYTSVVNKNAVFRLLFMLLKMEFPKKYYALLSMVNAYTEFGGQKKSNFLQIKINGKKSESFFNETVNGVINKINSEGLLLETRKGYYFLGTEILTQKHWEEMMKRAINITGTDERIIKMQIFRGFSWMRISYGKTGKQIMGIAEIISDTNF